MQKQRRHRFSMAALNPFHPSQIRHPRDTTATATASSPGHGCQLSSSITATSDVISCAGMRSPELTLFETHGQLSSKPTTPASDSVKHLPSEGRVRAETCHFHRDPVAERHDDGHRALSNRWRLRVRRLFLDLFRSPPAATADATDTLVSSMAVSDDGFSSTNSLQRQRSHTFTTGQAFPLDGPTFLQLYVSTGKELGAGSGGSVTLFKRRLPVQHAIRRSGSRERGKMLTEEHEHVAVKQLRLRRPKEPPSRYRERMQTEIQLLLEAQQHPNIGKVICVFASAIGVGSPDDSAPGADQVIWKIVQPVYPTDLFQLLTAEHAQQPLSAVKRQRISAQLASAIAHLHSLGIAHRDIKLENICLDANDNVRLVDFGSSTRTEEYGYRKKCCGLYGSDPYIAPEIVGYLTTGQNKSSIVYYGDLADAWSLGIVLLCLLRRAFLWDKALLTDTGYSAFMKRRERIFIGVDATDKECGVTEDEKEVILGLLEPQPVLRWSVKDQTVSHPWIQAVIGRR